MKLYLEKWDKIFYALLLGFVITMPFSFGYKLNNLFIILIFVHSIFRFRFSSLRSWIHYSPLLLLYIILIFGLIYTANLNQGLFDLEKKIAFIIFPYAFLVSNKISQRLLKRILLAFSLSTVAISLLSIVVGIYKYSTTGDVSVFYYYELTNFVEMHPSYLSMYTCFSFFILFAYWFEVRDKIKPRNTAIIFVCLLFLFSFVVLLSARSEILILLLMIISGSIWLGVRNGRLVYVYGVISLFFVIITLIVAVSPTIRERFKEAINYNSEYSIDKQWGGRALRLLKWDCSADIILSNPLLGVGTGDTQDKLQECYAQKEYGQLLFYPDVKYNAHNQYLQTAIGNGIIGLIPLLMCLILGIYVSIKTENLLFFSFLVLFALACMTESMLEVNKGIVFFSFFWSLFLNTSKHLGN